MRARIWLCWCKRLQAFDTPPPWFALVCTQVPPPLRANVIYERPLTLCEQTHLYTAEYVSSNEILWVGEVRFSGLTNSRSIVERRVVQWPMYSSSIMVLLLPVQIHLFALELSLHFRPFRHQEFSISPRFLWFHSFEMFWYTLPFFDRRWRYNRGRQISNSIKCHSDQFASWSPQFDQTAVLHKI